MITAPIFSLSAVTAAGQPGKNSKFLASIPTVMSEIASLIRSSIRNAVRLSSSLPNSRRERLRKPLIILVIFFVCTLALIKMSVSRFSPACSLPLRSSCMYAVSDVNGVFSS